jgi:hypothetical protein
MNYAKNISMPLILLSLLFCWLIYSELTRDKPLFKSYLALLILLALSCAWPPFHHWHFERFLNSIAKKLAEHHPAVVHCNTLFDTLFDEDPGVGGHANPKTGYIVIQYPKCDDLMNYVAHPERANTASLYALDILTHESMHARGEYNEAKTECEAVQRNYRTAKLLGIPDDFAQKNARDYYELLYLKRNDGYFSSECAPGKALDEQLPDSTWRE